MNSYPMYGNNQLYMQDLQAMRDRIDNQMRQAQAQQSQIQQTPANITQNFQLQPQNLTDFDGKYANDIEEVKNTLTLKNTLFVNKNMDSLWFKNPGGDIKTYSLTEVIELDPKDKEIAELKQQLTAMQQMIEIQNKPVTAENKNEKKNTKKEE